MGLIIGGLALLGTAAAVAWAKWGGGADEARAKTEDLERATAAAVKRNSARIDGELEASLTKIEASRDRMAELWAKAETEGRAQDERDAVAAVQRAKDVVAAFWDTAEAETNSRAQTSAFAFKTPEIQDAIRSGASDAGLEWSTSFMHETDGLVHTIQDTMTLADDGSGWRLAGSIGAEHFAAPFIEESGKLDLALAQIAGNIGGPLGEALNTFRVGLNATGEDGTRQFGNLQAGVMAVGSAMSQSNNVFVSTLGNSLSALAQGDWVGAAIAAATGFFTWFSGKFTEGQRAFNDWSDSLIAGFSRSGFWCVDGCRVDRQSRELGGQREGF